MVDLSRRFEEFGLPDLESYHEFGRTHYGELLAGEPDFRIVSKTDEEFRYRPYSESEQVLGRKLNGRWLILIPGLSGKEHQGTC